MEANRLRRAAALTVLLADEPLEGLEPRELARQSTAATAAPVCRAWLAEHPADEAELAAPAWVMRVVPADKPHGLTGKLSSRLGEVFWLRNMVTGALTVFACGGLLPFALMTRGEFRSLCRGLRIELREPEPATGDPPSPGQPEPAKPAASGEPHPLAWEVG